MLKCINLNFYIKKIINLNKCINSILKQPKMPYHITLLARKYYLNEEQFINAKF
jgi:hypothetical protein